MLRYCTTAMLVVAAMLVAGCSSEGSPPSVDAVADIVAEDYATKTQVVIDSSSCWAYPSGTHFDCALDYETASGMTGTQRLDVRCRDDESCTWKRI